MKTKDDILNALVQRFAAESPSVLKEAAYNMALASTGEVTESNFMDRASQALARIKQKMPQNPLKEETLRIYASALSVCPICKHKMNLVKLLEDREVFYCNDHKICQPLPIGE